MFRSYVIRYGIKSTAIEIIRVLQVFLFFGMTFRLATQLPHEIMGTFLKSYNKLI